MNQVIDVETGQVKAGRENAVLRANAIGSCIAITAYDSGKKVGAIVHVMLPGRSPKEDYPHRTRYAADAIDAMIDQMACLGVNKNDLEVCLVGGGNVLQRNDDTVCEDNIKSVVNLLGEKGIRIRASVLGGTQRRSVSLNLERGCIFYIEGNEEERLLQYE
ncbi:MAG: chemotaxis protein CheD [Bacteroidetes bacterium]|nr:chemotaxis protein CheD [Bacteroidota bacterium]